MTVCHRKIVRPIVKLHFESNVTRKGAFAEELSSIPNIESVGMTSNGVALTRRLPALHRAGLTRLNLSLDSLRPDRLETMSRRPV